MAVRVTTPAENLAYVSVGGENVVKVYRRNGGTPALVASIPTSDTPHALWPSADNRSVYVGQENADSVAVIDVAGQRVVKQIPVGQAPQAIVFVANAVPTGSSAAGAENLTRQNVGAAHRAPRAPGARRAGRQGRAHRARPAPGGRVARGAPRACARGRRRQPLQHALSDALSGRCPLPPQPVASVRSETVAALPSRACAIRVLTRRVLGGCRPPRAPLLARRQIPTRKHRHAHDLSPGTMPYILLDNYAVD